MGKIYNVIVSRFTLLVLVRNHHGQRGCHVVENIQSVMCFKMHTSLVILLKGCWQIIASCDRVELGNPGQCKNLAF